MVAHLGTQQVGSSIKDYGISIFTFFCVCVWIIQTIILCTCIVHVCACLPQVKSQCTELLKHPLMYNLIEHKWSKFGRTIFSLMLLFHILLVIFLTAFALRLLNPFSPTCTYNTSLHSSHRTRNNYGVKHAYARITAANNYL